VKKYFILLTMFFAMISCSQAIGTKGNIKEIEIVFDSVTDKLPAHCLIDDKYYKETGNIFLINENYVRKYSELIEYNVLEKKKVNTIASYEKGTRISEFDMKNGVIVWSLQSEAKEKNRRIYYYKINHKKVEEFEVENNFEKDGGFIPFSLKTNGEEISYIENTLNKSKVILFNLSNKTKVVVAEEEHYEDFYKSRMFFTEIYEDKLFYDLRENNEIYIAIWDLKEKKLLKKLKSEKGTLLHFNGSYNKEKNYLVLYGKNSEDEYIYKYDLNNFKSQKLVGFDKRSYVYKDRILTNEKNINYVVQKDVSGDVQDHYMVEKYSLINYEIKDYQSYFDIFESKEKISMIKFEEGISKVRLEIYKK
jgi:hypothetical protein